jgi:hypothetical protein
VGNVVPACVSCNTSECNAEVSSWMRRKRLDEPALLLRFAQISRTLDAVRGMDNGVEPPIHSITRQRLLASTRSSCRPFGRAPR